MKPTLEDFIIDLKKKFDPSLESMTTVEIQMAVYDACGEWLEKNGNFDQASEVIS